MSEVKPVLLGGEDLEKGSGKNIFSSQNDNNNLDSATIEYITTDTYQINL